jgi:3-phenylpropionate/trans-cinnamate dioxygenase ferredoxin reductase subunit
MGQDRPFTATPWFWSDQYDKKLQMAGLSMGADAWAVRGDMGGDITTASFTVFHFRGSQLLGADSVNASKDHLVVRKLLDAGVSPTPQQVADPGCDLGSLISK